MTTPTREPDVELTLRLPTEHIEYLHRLAALSGTPVEHVFNVILAMHILRERS